MTSTESTCHERAAKGLAAIKKLQGTTNYITWSDKVLLILASHGFDSDEKSRTLKIDDKNADRRIRATMLLAMEDSVCNAVRSSATSEELWNLTKSKFGTPSKMVQGQLLSRFYGDHLQRSQSVQAFIDEKRSLQQQLNNAGCNVPDSKLALMILVGARNKYESVCESLVDNDNLSVATVEERLIHAEEARGIEGKSAGVDVAMKAVGRTQAKTRCSKCGKVAFHKAENCWLGMKCGKCGGEHPDHACRRSPMNLRPEQMAKLVQLLNSMSTDKASDVQGYTLCAAFNAAVSSEGSLIVDSGATNHMTGQRHLLVATRRCNGSVRVANNAQERIEMEGRRSVTFDTGVHESIPMLCVPGLGSTTLLSVRRLCEGGRKMVFSSKDCVLHDIDGGIVAKGSLTSNGLYQFSVGTQESTHLVNDSHEQVSAIRCKDSKLWHQRLGHRNFRDIDLLAGGLAKGMATSSRPTTPSGKRRCCSTCEISKARKQPFPASSETRPKQVLSLVVSDVCGKMQVPSLGGAEYFVVFVDVASEKIFTYLLRRKSDVLENFVRFLAWAERKTGKKLKILRTDNGGEYLSREFKELFAGSGVEHQTTVPYCSPQNGIAERRHYTLMNSVRSMLHHSGLSNEYWGAAVLYATDIANSCPCARDCTSTPSSRFGGEHGSTDVSMFRVFGCDCYALRPHRRKLDNRATPLVFIGLARNQKGWKLYDPRKREISTHRHVTFNENSFTHHKMTRKDSESELEKIDISSFLPTSAEEPEGEVQDSILDGKELANRPEANEQIVRPEPRRSSRRRHPPQPFWLIQPEDTNNAEHNGDQEHQHPAGSDTTESRDHIASEDSFFDCDSDGGDGVTEAAQAHLSHSLTTVRDALFEIDQTEAANQGAAFQAYQAICMNAADKSDMYTPSTYFDAMRCEDRDKWKGAIAVELEAIKRNHVLAEVPRVPAGHKAIGAKWIFKIKYNKDGSVDKYKARLVCQGFRQRQGLDYKETFAPVVRLDSLRLLLALAATDSEIEILHLDAISAFLNGRLKEKIFMKAPPGLPSNSGFFQLLRTLYGLKQAPREWHAVVEAFLVGNPGFSKVKSASCLYVKREGTRWCIVALYVDDLVIAGHTQLTSPVRTALMNEFAMTDNGELSFCLGLEVQRNSAKASIRVSQKQYANDILERYGMANCKAAPTPAAEGIRLTSDMSPKTARERDQLRVDFKDLPFRAVVGSLLYLCNTRPDLQFAVGQVSRFTEDPGRQHYIALKRILRYVRGTLSYGIVYSGGQGVVLGGSTDADWAGDPETRRSTSGYIITLGGAPVSWRSSRQKCLATSSCEAEYVAACAAGQDLVWLRRVLDELGFSQEGPSILLEDNQGCIRHAKNQTDHGRMKHIDVKKFFVRELVQAGEIELRYIPTEEMPADMMTKALGRLKFAKCRQLAGAVPT